MGLASLPWTLAGRGVDALSKTLDGAWANTTAFAGDLIGRRGDPLEERDPEFIRSTLPVNRQLANVFFRPRVSGLENIPEDGPGLAQVRRARARAGRGRVGVPRRRLRELPPLVALRGDRVRGAQGIREA